MRKLLLSLVLVCVGPVAAVRAQDDVHADPLEHLAAEVAEQDKLIADGKADQVVAVWREKSKDGVADHLYLLGRALGLKAGQAIEKKDDGEAKRLLDEAGESCGRATETAGPGYAPAHLGLAQVALLRFVIARRELDRLPDKERDARIADVVRELDPAVDHLRKALALAPDFRDAAIELARVQWTKGLDGEAMSVLAKFVADHPKDNVARLELAKLKLRRKEFAEAEPELRAVLGSDAKNLAARRLLAMDLLSQDRLEEAAKEWEFIRAAEPKDEQAYGRLFEIYVRLKKPDDARKVLEALVAALPGTDWAKRARMTLDELAADPQAFERMGRVTPDQLVKRLESKDPAEVLATLEKMREYQWEQPLPKEVYELLRRDHGNEAQRLAAVRLIGDQCDPQTLALLEVLLMHPAERETDAPTRREIAHAMSRLPTDAVVPILYEALTDSDADVREWAVQGIAARTGKWFRNDLATRTPDKDWPAELDLYRRWWSSTSSSAAKRSGVTAMAEIYGRLEKSGKVRISRYALAAMDDPLESTWRAGYDLFRRLAQKGFGAEQGPVEEDERTRIAHEAHVWLDQELHKK